MVLLLLSFLCRLEGMAVDEQQRAFLQEALQQQAALHASSTQVGTLTTVRTALLLASWTACTYVSVPPSWRHNFTHLHRTLVLLTLTRSHSVTLSSLSTLHPTTSTALPGVPGWCVLRWCCCA